MAELADALDSGSSTRKGVEVQVLSSAPVESISCKDLKCPRREGFSFFVYGVCASLARFAHWVHTGVPKSPGCEAVSDWFAMFY